jgi:hypothetical protein
MGKGRPKGSKNKRTLVLEVAKALVESAVMDKAELMGRLSRMARADVGKHLKVTDGIPAVHVDAENTDIIREITVKRTVGTDGVSTETRLKIADPVTPLMGIAEIYGLKKQPAPTVDMAVLIQMLQVNVEPAKLREAALAALEQED